MRSTSCGAVTTRGSGRAAVALLLLLLMLLSWPMNTAVIVLLVGLWAAILMSALLRDRGGRSPVATVDSFERSMGILASQRFGSPRRPGRRVMVVHDPARLGGRRSRARTLRRRRQVVQALAGIVAATALAALVAGGPFVVALVAAVAALAGYLALLAYLRTHEHQQRRVVRIDAADAPRRRLVSAQRQPVDRIA